MDECILRDVDDVDVFYRRWLPSGEVKLVVLVAHGMAEHSGRYDRLARVLVAEGYAVYALDHRGHGRTASATGVGRTGPRGMDGALDSIAALAQVARDDHPGLPTVLFGHSMGSMLAFAYAERHGNGLAGLILSGSPGYHENLRAGAQLMQDAVDGGMADESVMALSPLGDMFERRTPFDWLSRDDAEVDAYMVDPFCGENHPMTHGFLAALTTLAADSMEPEAIERLPKALPVLFLTGTADPVSSNAAGVRALEKRVRDAGLAVDAIYYEDARHEVLNETNRDEVHADIVEWIGSVAARR